jgi:hypothetical protein
MLCCNYYLPIMLGRQLFGLTIRHFSLRNQDSVDDTYELFHRQSFFVANMIP